MNTPLALPSSENQPFTQISVICEDQKACCNDGVILLTDETNQALLIDDQLTTEGGIGDKSTCKRSQEDLRRGVNHTVNNYSEQETVKRRDQQ